MGQPWSPPGLPRPWPADEYLIDGGDRAGQVNVAQDWSVHGLDEEDTIVHYDTLQGKLVVQPSNRVAVYAPRFAAVRRVDGIVQNEHTFSTLANHQIQNLRMDRESLNTSRLTQQLQPRRHLALSTPNGFRERLPDRSVDNVQNAAGTASVYESYEDFSIIRRGVFDNNEKPRLNQRIQASLEDDGFNVTAMHGMGITTNFDIAQVEPSAIVEFARECFGSQPPADSLFVSCTNFQAVTARPMLQELYGIPVVTSNHAALEVVRRVLSINSIA